MFWACLPAGFPRAGLDTKWGTAEGLIVLNHIVHIPQFSSALPSNLVYIHQPLFLQQAFLLWSEPKSASKPKVPWPPLRSCHLTSCNTCVLLSPLQAIRIMELTLQKYGSYENFELATGGSLLPRSRIWSYVRKYMLKEGCLGEVGSRKNHHLTPRGNTQRMPQSQPP